MLDIPEVKNQTIQVGGPEALSPLEVVQIFEETSGKTFETEHLPVEALQDQKQKAPDPLQASFSGLMLDYASGNPMNMQQTLQKFQVQLVSVRDYARQVQ